MLHKVQSCWVRYRCGRPHDSVKSLYCTVTHQGPRLLKFMHLMNSHVNSKWGYMICYLYKGDMSGFPSLFKGTSHWLLVDITFFMTQLDSHNFKNY